MNFLIQLVLLNAFLLGVSFAYENNYERYENFVRKGKRQKFSYQKLWEEHKGQYAHRINDDIIYETDSDKTNEAFSNFVNRVDLITDHNEQFNSGKFLYKKKVNKFSHYSFDKFAEIYLIKTIEIEEPPKKKSKKTYTIPNYYKKLSIIKKSTLVNTSLPDVGINWPLVKCVDTVQAQGACGSCYSFASLTTLETNYCIQKSGILTPYSEQHLIDCSNRNSPVGNPYKNQGCIGGNIAHSYNYIKDNGIMFKKDYPYYDYIQLAKTADVTTSILPCKYNKTAAQFVLKDFTTISNNVTAMKTALKAGILSGYIYVTENLYLYDKGIFGQDILCKNIKKAVNHGIVIVGWGVSNNVDYWIVRNTWGTDWGEDGYFRIRMGVNLCNIEMMAVYPNFI